MGNVASTVPYGAHSSLLNTTLTCIDLNNLAQAPFPIPFTFQATAPLTSNTQIYFTDIYVKGTFGPTIYELESNTTIYFSTNASPPTFALTASRIISGDDTASNVPLDGVATAGPFQMINDFAHLKVRYVAAHAYNGDIDYNFNCSIPSSIIISTAKAGLSSANTSPGTGVRNIFPATPVGSKTDVANVPMSCSGKAYNFTLQGTVPASVPASTKFNVSDVVAFLSTAVGNESAFIAAYGRQNGNNVAGIVAQLANASPQSVDISRAFTATDPSTSNPLSGGVYTDGTPQNLTIAAPRRGSLTGAFTAGSSGVISAAVQSIAGTLDTTDGNSVFSCKAKNSQALLTAPIV